MFGRRAKLMDDEKAINELLAKNEPTKAVAAEKPKASGRAFTSLLLGVFGCLLLIGSILLFYLYKKPVGSQPSEPPPAVQKGQGPGDAVKGAISDAITQATKKPLERGQQKLWLNLSAGIGSIAGIMGLVGMILGILALRLDGPPRGTAAIGTCFSLIAFLGLFLAGYNKFMEWKMMQEDVNQIADLSEKTFGKDGIYGKAFKMVDAIGGKLLGPMNAELMAGGNHVGSMAPELKVNLVNRPRSPEILLSAQRGVRPVLLIFLSTSAPDCRELITQLKTLDTNTNPQELLILAVSKTETPETLFTSVQNLGIRFRTGTTDSDLPSPYSEAVPPSVLAIDAKGILRGHAVGAEKVGKLNLTRLVENLKKHGQR